MSIKKIKYHIECLQEDWERHRSGLNLEEVEILFSRMIKKDPLRKWRVIQTITIEEVYEEYEPS